MMLLSREQILDRIQAGRLVIDPPPDDASISDIAVDLRLGTSFISFKPSPGVELDLFFSPSPSDIWHPVTIELGQAFHLQPGETVQAVTLESISCPHDLAAFIFPRNALSRIGLSCQSGIIQPGWQGKLVLVIHNFGVVPIALYAGLKFATLLFSEVQLVSEVQLAVTRAATPYGEQDLRVEIETLRQTLEERAKHLVTEKEQRPRIRDLVYQAMEAEKEVKGKALETLMVTIFQTIKGISVVDVNTRLKAEELARIIHGVV